MKDEKVIANRQQFLRGLRDGAPVGVGYLAVSFALGITLAGVGLTPVQSFVTSILCLSSTGEYAGSTIIASNAVYTGAALITLITNARYLLMSTALSQRVREGTPLRHRMAMSYAVTDEIFSLTIAQPYADPFYMYGAAAAAAPMWAAGTALGAIAGEVLPVRLVNALGVALYGMFIAAFIPPARKDRVVLGLVAVSFAASAAMAYLPVVSGLSEGNRTIILTVVISALAALIFPRKEADDIDS